MNDLDIAQSAHLRDIGKVAASIGILPEQLYAYGPYIAKITTPPPQQRGRLILVTAMTPTPAGEGKTTVSIGLTQALGRLGKRVAVALREPSLGPVFGIKGGATGGGRSQVLPMEEINLHFTGDFHAVAAAANLLAALVDNHLHQGNALGLDPRRIEYKRTMDMNDRALRKIVVGLGGRSGGIPREDGFDIVVASEVMAIMALADSLADLKERLGRIRVGYDTAGHLVTAKDLRAHGAMTALLVQALRPNLVQTLEGQPAFIHMGPFANSAHGANSVVATRMALAYADLTVTEAGFGSDLGAEKFFNMVARTAGFAPDTVVVVSTVRALRHHGGAGDFNTPDKEAVQEGLANLARHLDIVRLHGLNPVLTLNRFSGDSAGELDVVREFAASQGVRYAPCEAWARGGEGGLELAEAVLDSLEQPSNYKPLYPLSLSIREKIERITTEVYGAGAVEYTSTAKAAIRRAEREGCGGLPVIIAKTPASLSDNPKLRNCPEGFTVTVTDLKPRYGAGFVVAYMGQIMTMPGLPKEPAANRIDVDAEGRIQGLF